MSPVPHCIIPLSLLRSLYIDHYLSTKLIAEYLGTRPTVVQWQISKQLPPMNGTRTERTQARQKYLANILNQTQSQAIAELANNELTQQEITELLNLVPNKHKDSKTITIVDYPLTKNSNIKLPQRANKDLLWNMLPYFTKLVRRYHKQGFTMEQIRLNLDIPTCLRKELMKCLA